VKGQPRWVEIDHGALAHNVAALRGLLGESQLWAVIKAQAYGHGPVETAHTVLKAGADGLVVAVVEEAIELRSAGLKAPILVLTPPLPDETPEFAVHELVAAVADEATARALSAAGVAHGRPIPVHVKVDTGMGRLGVMPERAPALVQAAGDLPGIRVAGVFTHFANADDEDLSSARRQLAVFNEVLDNLVGNGPGPRPFLTHAANSAAAIVLPESRLSLARIGLALYGYAPSPAVAGCLNRAGIRLRPALAFRTRVAAVRRVPKGWPVSYGSTYVPPVETTIATLPVGYSDGVSRTLSHKLHVLVHGQRRPVVGRICMNHCMVDVGDLPVRPGDVVTLLGQDGQASITADEWAAHLGTISYEVLCMVGTRPRRHVPGPP